MQKVLLIGFALLLFLPNLFNKDITPIPAYDHKEKFDPRLAYINSISKLEAYTDSLAMNKNIIHGSYDYVELLEVVIEQRFYHGFSHFSLSENWIAALAGKYLKEGYQCKVQPELMMQHANAACSQQALVMMAVLRNKKMIYRSVGFPHHYAMEVLLNKEWYFFDANMEPGITKEQRKLSSWKHQNDQLKQYYDPARFSALDYQFGNGLTATTGIINEVPAFNARVFHAVTGVLSKILWCFPLLLLFYRPKFKTTRPFITFSLQRRRPALSLSV